MFAMGQAEILNSVSSVNNKHMWKAVRGKFMAVTY